MRQTADRFLTFPESLTRQRPGTVRRLLALDTEDNSDGEVQIINFFDGVRHTTFRGPDMQLNAWNWMFTQEPATVWACNVEYDLINLCGAWLGKMATLTYRGSAGLLRASWRDCRIQFFDTLRHWPMSVEQMGRYLGIQKLERIHRGRCAGTGRCRKCLAYCRRDTEIVWQFVSHMLRRYEHMKLRLRATLPSMALQLFQTRFYRKPWTAIDGNDRSWFREGYYGGRVEVYHFGVVRGPIHHYDVNSLFPSVMKACRYPDLTTFERTSTPSWDQEGMAELTIMVPETRYPCLPARSHELVYPYGVIQGTWPYPEIRAALERGAKILKVHRAVQYHALPLGQPFAKYVEFCYAKRMGSTHDLDRVFWKLMMNSLYGKFGQGEGLIIIYNDKEFEHGRTAGHSNVIWAAYVTSHARVRLLEFLESTSVCYYTDTDSLFTPDVLPTSTKLGKLKWEGTATKAQFFGNKLYLMWDYHSDCGMCKARGKVDGTICTKCHGTGRMTKAEIVKAKGVPPDAAGDFIRTGRAVYRQPIRFRESRSSAHDANVWMVEEKERDDLYTKRRVMGNGTTWPWQWHLYQRVREEGTLADPRTGAIGLSRTKRFDPK